MKRIKWHPEAVTDLEAILCYCKQRFGSKVARKVREKILHTVSLLKFHPCLGVIDPLLVDCTSLEYRALQAGTYTKVIYSVHEDFIYIHLLWDVRRDEEGVKRAIDYRYHFPEKDFPYQVNESLADYVD